MFINDVMQIHFQIINKIFIPIFTNNENEILINLKFVTISIAQLNKTYLFFFFFIKYKYNIIVISLLKMMIHCRHRVLKYLSFHQ